MNVIIFDLPSSITHLSRSILLAQRHRVSVAADAEDARLKIDTALFDAILIGPAGAPEELTGFIEREFPHLPIVLAGSAVAAAPQGQVAAVLPAPVSGARLVAAFRNLERRRRERIESTEVQLAGADGVSVACRLADLTSEGLVIAGESDAFYRWMGASPRRLEAAVAGAAISGDVLFTEAKEFSRRRTVGVKLDAPSARALLASLLR